jgi:hypothetical protein
MPNTFELIASTTLGSAASSIDFTSIPSTYTDLCVLLSTRNSSTNLNNSIGINGSTSNFSLRVLGGDGSSTYSASRTDNLNAFLSTESGNTSNTFASTYFYFPNYAGSTNKSYSVDNVTENNGSGAYAQLLAGLWSQTAAINRITFYAGNGASNFVTNSTAYLYGVKNA